MSSGLLEPLRRNIGLRLSLLYALIFTLSSVALLALAYYLLAAAVGSKDREVLEARLKEAAVVYETGGVIGLRSWVRQPARSRCRTPCSSAWPTPITTPPWSSARRKTGWRFKDVPGWEGFLKTPYIRIPQNAERDYHPGPRASCPTAGSCRLAGRPTAAKPS